MALPDRKCEFIGKEIGIAEGEKPFDLYEGENPIRLFACNLKRAKWQGLAGSGVQFPIKKYCRVFDSVELQKDCLENAKILPATIYVYKKK